MTKTVTKLIPDLTIMPSNKPYRDKEWLSRRVREGYSPDAIASICNVSTSTIERWLDRNEIRPYRDEDWLQRQIEQHVSERAIATWCGVSEQTVKRWMRKYDIEHPGLAPASVMESYIEQRFENRSEVPMKTQIFVLWQRYKTRVQKAELARAVGASPSCA